jgi:hypothetical protein
MELDGGSMQAVIVVEQASSRGVQLYTLISRINNGFSVRALMDIHIPNCNPANHLPGN